MTSQSAPGLRSWSQFPCAFSESLLIFPASGNLNNGSGGFNNVGSNGNYWSCSPNNASNGYNLNFNSGNVNPSNNNNRANGFTVRWCSSICKKMRAVFID